MRLQADIGRAQADRSSAGRQHTSVKRYLERRKKIIIIIVRVAQENLGSPLFKCGALTGSCACASGIKCLLSYGVNQKQKVRRKCGAQRESRTRSPGVIRTFSLAKIPKLCQSRVLEIEFKHLSNKFQMKIAAFIGLLFFFS